MEILPLSPWPNCTFMLITDSQSWEFKTINSESVISTEFFFKYILGWILIASLSTPLGTAQLKPEMHHRAVNFTVQMWVYVWDLSVIWNTAFQFIPTPNSIQFWINFEFKIDFGKMWLFYMLLLTTLPCHCICIINLFSSCLGEYFPLTSHSILTISSPHSVFGSKCLTCHLQFYFCHRWKFSPHSKITKES